MYLYIVKYDPEYYFITEHREFLDIVYFKLFGYKPLCYVKVLRNATIMDLYHYTQKYTMRYGNLVKSIINIIKTDPITYKGHQLQLLCIKPGCQYYQLIDKNGKEGIIKMNKRTCSNVWDHLDFNYGVDTLFMMRNQLYQLYLKQPMYHYLYLQYALFSIEYNADVLKLIMNLYLLLPNNEWVM